MKVKPEPVVLQTVVIFTTFGIALFLPAGTLLWTAGWIFLGLFFVFFCGVNAWLFRHNPGLLQERLHLARPDQKGWDKVLFPLLEALCLGWLAFMALDAVRFHWSRLPVWLQVFGGLLLLASFYLFFLTFRENSYLSPVERIQGERGQMVISSGPYHIVRHPMYSAMVIFFIATPLLLGSGYGVLFGLGLAALLARRAVLEEKMLKRELLGYEEYTHQVKYRFVPHVW
jgi:protein-S-isoprenylcysteine O-methyltransferase Ste14